MRYKCLGGTKGLTLSQVSSLDVHTMAYPAYEGLYSSRTIVRALVGY